MIYEVQFSGVSVINHLYIHMVTHIRFVPAHCSGDVFHRSGELIQVSSGNTENTKYSIDNDKFR